MNKVLYIFNYTNLNILIKQAKKRYQQEYFFYRHLGLSTWKVN
ncbi:hypothetical protein [Shewanella maritima]